MPPPVLPATSRPLDIVTACRSADLQILRYALTGIKRFLPFRHLYVFTAAKNFGKFQRHFGEEVTLLNEDSTIPGMTLEKLRKLPLAGFPQGAGWYFQQLLKLSFCFERPDDDYYLIWDADTIPLRPLQFFDEAGKMIFTVADEEHRPYFETYHKLLGEEPHREFSFISQHCIVQKSALREMLDAIETRFAGSDSWAWKIMRNLEGEGTNLFSEYEMIGHYIKNHYPDRTVFRELPWLRDGSRKCGGMPSARALERLAADYAFAAFESSQMPLRRWIRWLRSKLRG